jgi:hypothetical protein
MTLYKATERGNVPMTKDEEDQIKADWAAAAAAKEAEAAKPPKKTLEERVAALEAKLDVK